MTLQTQEIVLSVQNVHKSFNRRLVSAGAYTTFKTQLVQWLKGSKEGYQEALRRQNRDVLRGISFDVGRGETLGIIGENGAGKSTLLKLLTGIYKPTRGVVSKKGRISALLELGAGFHPEFSGRENIYMNGLILGLEKKTIREKEQEIIEFSELAEFIDAPVRTYSSGMYMRLAFSIAVNVNPDILLIDEILAVGDEHFRHKSAAKIRSFQNGEIAIVLVSHDLGNIRQWCSRAIWIDEGRIAAEGEPGFVVDRYLECVRLKEAGSAVL